VVPRHRLDTLTAVSKWATVLESYPTLRLNLAHFPTGRLERKQQQEIVALVLGYGNVYVDVSCRGTSDAYYQGLKALFDRMPTGDREKLTSRILFGSDFAVNLMWIESYNRYIDIFSRTEALTPAEKLAFCSTNPERFLFPGHAGVRGT
jgi:predicted TIM-barrel fold metal-dependent hydrolase